MQFRQIQCIVHLEGVNISQPVLHMAVHHQFTETQHLSAQMEGIPESGLLSFLGNRDINTGKISTLVKLLNLSLNK